MTTATAAAPPPCEPQETSAFSPGAPATSPLLLEVLRGDLGFLCVYLLGQLYLMSTFDLKWKKFFQQ